MSVRRDPVPSISRRRRRLPAVLAAAVLTVAAVLVPAGAAQAVPTLVTCTGTESVTYSPGLTNTPTSIATSRADDYDPCTHVVGLSITSETGVSGVSGTATIACTTLLSSGSAAKTITWSDATTSVFSFSYVANAVGANVVVVATGTITSGRYAGATAVEEITYAGLVSGLLACGTPGGITGLTGTTVLTITDV